MSEKDEKESGKDEKESEKIHFEQEFNLWLEMRRQSARVAHSLKAEDIRSECYPLQISIWSGNAQETPSSQRKIKTYDEMLSMCELLLESLKEIGAIQKYKISRLKSPKSYKFD